jgi:hypothetical protein
MKIGGTRKRELFAEVNATGSGIVDAPGENVLVTESALASAYHLLDEAMVALCAAADSRADDDELLSVLTMCEGVERRIDRLAVSTIATLSRRGVFAARGYKSAAAALADLFGWERFEARRRVVAAEQVCPRTGLDGTVLPPRLPATAQVFTAGRAGLRHVEVVARLLATPAAARLAPPVWAGAEHELPSRPPTTPRPGCWPTAPH